MWSHIICRRMQVGNRHLILHVSDKDVEWEVVRYLDDVERTGSYGVLDRELNRKFLMIGVGKVTSRVMIK